jgi:hypothetical protein
MKGVLPIFITSPSGSKISSAILSGQFHINQKSPFSIGGDLAETLYNYNFTNEMYKYSVESIYRRFTNRNSTFEYDHSTVIQSYTNSVTTDVKIKINVSEYEPAMYYPGILENLKLAWVQYYALLVPVYILLCMRLFGMNIKSDVFQSVETNDCTSNLKKHNYANNSQL